jgi:D-lactate dehydrogenase
MMAVKKLADPFNLLNPGVVLNADADCHVKHLKKLPQVEEEVDKCIECGFCENRCPSRDFTLTPRQRIVLRRSIKQLEEGGDLRARNELLHQYRYDALDTCATDGMCATDCPVNINTGELVKRLRKENHSAFSNKVALWVAKNFSFVASCTSVLIKTASAFNKVFGANTVGNITKLFAKIFPGFPHWNNYIAPAKKFTAVQQPGADVVFFTSCINRIMGNAENKVSNTEMFLSLAEKANIKVGTPTNINSLCCSQVFSSKGFYAAQQQMSNKTVEQLWKQSNDGKIPVVIDFTSCTLTLQQQRPYLTDENKMRFDKMQVVDIVFYLNDVLLPKLKINKRKERIALHPVCSVHKMGSMQQLGQLANACSKEVLLPANAGCCGMAGDRGFYYPGLTHAATAAEADEVKQKDFDGYYSSAKTCELAMSQAVGKNYQNVLQLLYECVE